MCQRSVTKIIFIAFRKTKLQVRELFIISYCILIANLKLMDGNKSYKSDHFIAVVIYNARYKLIALLWLTRPSGQ